MRRGLDLAVLPEMALTGEGEPVGSGGLGVSRGRRGPGHVRS